MRTRSIRSRNSRRARAAALAVSLAIASTSALAGRPSSATAPSDASQASQKEARAVFKQAQDAFQLGDFDKALTLYTRVFELLSSPVLLFNIAQCHRNLHNYE